METVTESTNYICGGICMLKDYFTRKDTRFGFFKEDLKITCVIYAVWAAIGAGCYFWNKKKEKERDEAYEGMVKRMEDIIEPTPFDEETED